MLQGARDLTPSHIRKVVASDFARTLLGSISLTRLFYHVGVLHPQIRGIGLRWLRDRKVVEDYRILHGSEETDEYRLSPIRATIERGTPLQRRLDRPVLGSRAQGAFGRASPAHDRPARGSHATLWQRRGCADSGRSRDDDVAAVDPYCVIFLITATGQFWPAQRGRSHLISARNKLLFFQRRYRTAARAASDPTVRINAGPSSRS
jgi:hypothetical protein